MKGYGFAKSQKPPYSVIPAKAGIHCFYRLTKFLNPVFQRGDDFTNPSKGTEYGNQGGAGLGNFVRCLIYPDASLEGLGNRRGGRLGPRHPGTPLSCDHRH